MLTFSRVSAGVPPAPQTLFTNQSDSDWTQVGTREAAWKAIVKTYLSLEYCDYVDRGCPLPALAPEMARVDMNMRSQIFTELVKYKDRMLPFMQGRRTRDKERAFFVIFSTMVGAVEIARMLPDRGAQEKVLSSTREFLLCSF